MKNKLKNMNSFISRFAFNSDVDLEYFANGFSSKPYIEQLRIRVNYLIKSQKQTKKIYANRMVQTSKNRKKSIELLNELDLNYFKTVDILKDTHHFLVCLLNLHILIQKHDGNAEAILDNYQSNTTSFTEIIEKIDFTKDEKYILNGFNRMRNIIIHAPSSIVIEYLSDIVLEEFQVIIYGLLEIMSKILEKDSDILLNILKCRRKRKDLDELSYVETLSEFAARYGLTANEVLQIVKDSDHDFIAEVRINMPIDSFDKKAIIDDVKKLVKKKQELKNKEIMAQRINIFHKEDKLLIVDIVAVLKQYNNDYDYVINSIYDICELVKPKSFVLVSNGTNKIVTSIKNELFFLVKGKECYSLETDEVETFCKDNIDKKIATYSCETIYPSLNNVNGSKYVLINKNQKLDSVDCNLDNFIKIVLSDKNIIEIVENVITEGL